VLDLMHGDRLHPELVTSDQARFANAPQAISRHVLGEATKTVLVD
jgi:hypothetical protein